MLVEEFLVERRESGKMRVFSMKRIIMDSEYDGRALVPDDLEQHQS